MLLPIILCSIVEKIDGTLTVVGFDLLYPNLDDCQIKEGGFYFMGREGFRQVFAPSAKEVQKQYRRHRKAAWTWFLVTLGLIAGVAISLYLLMGKYGDAIAHQLVNRITFGLIGLETVAAVAAIIAMHHHNTKADNFEWQLEHEYIILSPWEKSRFYNF